MKAAIIYASEDRARDCLVDIRTIEDLEKIAKREGHSLVLSFNADPSFYIESKMLRQPFERKKNRQTLLGITVYDDYLD